MSQETPQPPARAEAWTIQRLLLWTRDWLHRAGSPSPRIDAELLLGDVLHLRRLDLLLRFDQPVQQDELQAFKALIRRRARGEPVAYILGRKGFYGLDFGVGPDVLVPRPETESLVDAVVAFCRAREAPAGPVLDLGTGSGAIALALAHTLQEAGLPRPVLATDRSPEALTVACRNAADLGLGHLVTFAQGDLWAAVPIGSAYAAIVSNPPYILTHVLATLDRDVRDFEPHLALDGGADGLDVLRPLVAGMASRLLPGGLCGLEVGSREQAAQVAGLLKDLGVGAARVEAVQNGPTCLVLACKQVDSAPAAAPPDSGPRRAGSG